MLIDVIVQALVALFGAMLALIPTFTLPDMGGFGGTLGTNVAALNNYFPVVTLGACLLIIVSTRVALLAADTVITIYSLIPFKAR